MTDGNAKPLENTIIAMEEARFAAMVDRDLGKLGRLLADDLAYTHASGRQDDKASFLLSIDVGESVFDRITWSDRRVRVYSGVAAIVTGHAEMHLVRLGANKIVNIRFTDVWTRNSSSSSDTWQMVSWHSSPAT